MKKQIIKVFLICLHIYLIYFITNIVIYTFGIEKENKVNVSYFINNIKIIFKIIKYYVFLDNSYILKLQII